MQAALDSVLYDIWSMPHGIMGDTPFFLFFGHHMHTKLSALWPCPQATTGPRRDVYAEYAKLQSTVKQYTIGDKVFYCKGRGQIFSSKGVITSVLGNHAYIFKSDEGYSRTYNQADIRAQFSPDNERHTLSEEEWAYNTAVKKSHAQQHPRAKHGYNLRKKTVNPKVYSSVSFFLLHFTHFVLLSTIQ